MIVPRQMFDCDHRTSKAVVVNSRIRWLEIYCAGNTLALCNHRGVKDLSVHTATVAAIDSHCLIHIFEEDHPSNRFASKYPEEKCNWSNNQIDFGLYQSHSNIVLSTCWRQIELYDSTDEYGLGDLNLWWLAETITEHRLGDQSQEIWYLPTTRTSLECGQVKVFGAKQALGWL